jgi:CheY-like chemotaxis protein
MTEEEFIALLTDAYEHLYDLVYLRTHPLMSRFTQATPGSPNENAWRFHHILLEVIQEVDPGPKAPVFSREWRRHRLLTLRYSEGLTAQAVAEQLAISRRHYYRAHEEAMKAIAGLLWGRYMAGDGPAPQTPQHELDRMELLRLETAQMSRSHQQTDFLKIWQGVLELLGEQLARHQMTLAEQFPERMPSVRVDPPLLRQLLVGLLGYLIEITTQAELRCQLEAGDGGATLMIAVRASGELQAADREARAAGLNELASLCRVSLHPFADRHQVGFRVELPTAQAQPVILVVDDNDDILELMRRYLQPNQYQVAAAKDAVIAVELAAQMRPAAIVLDLMMPDRDGWDLLQFFMHQPATQTTPIVICSVLRQKELALSLGASAFLEKPFSEQQIVDVLNQLLGRTLEQPLRR